MKKIRVAGIIPLEEGFGFMHRSGVQKKDSVRDYYTFPGGGLEEGETPEEGTIREIEEEFGIKVKIIKKQYEMYSEKFNQDEIFYLCEYVSGKFGTGTGPEFTYNPLYADSGKFQPEIIKRDEIESINLLPYEIKDKFIEDLKLGNI